MGHKRIRTGTVVGVFKPSFDFSGQFAATLKVAVAGDDGREYYIHIAAHQIAALSEEKEGD